MNGDLFGKWESSPSFTSNSSIFSLSFEGTQIDNTSYQNVFDSSFIPRLANLGKKMKTRDMSFGLLTWLMFVINDPPSRMTFSSNSDPAFVFRSMHAEGVAYSRGGECKVAHGSTGAASISNDGSLLQLIYKNVAVGTDPCPGHFSICENLGVCSSNIAMDAQQDVAVQFDLHSLLTAIAANQGIISRPDLLETQTFVDTTMGYGKFYISPMYLGMTPIFCLTKVFSCFVSFKGTVFYPAMTSGAISLKSKNMNTDTNMDTNTDTVLVQELLRCRCPDASILPQCSRALLQIALLFWPKDNKKTYKFGSKMATFMNASYERGDEMINDYIFSNLPNPFYSQTNLMTGKSIEIAGDPFSDPQVLFDSLCPDKGCSSFNFYISNTFEDNFAVNKYNLQYGVLSPSSISIKGIMNDINIAPLQSLNVTRIPQLACVDTIFHAEALSLLGNESPLLLTQLYYQCTATQFSAVTGALGQSVGNTNIILTILLGGILYVVTATINSALQDENSKITSPVEKFKRKNEDDDIAMVALFNMLDDVAKLNAKLSETLAVGLEAQELASNSDQEIRSFRGSGKGKLNMSRSIRRRKQQLKNLKLFQELRALARVKTSEPNDWNLGPKSHLYEVAYLHTKKEREGTDSDEEDADSEKEAREKGFLLVTPELRTLSLKDRTKKTIMAPMKTSATVLDLLIEGHTIVLGDFDVLIVKDLQEVGNKHYNPLSLPTLLSLSDKRSGKGAQQTSPSSSASASKDGQGNAATKGALARQFSRRASVGGITVEVPPINSAAVAQHEKHNPAYLSEQFRNILNAAMTRKADEVMHIVETRIKAAEDTVREAIEVEERVAAESETRKKVNSCLEKVFGASVKVFLDDLVEHEEDDSDEDEDGDGDDIEEDDAADEFVEDSLLYGSSSKSSKSSKKSFDTHGRHVALVGTGLDDNFSRSPVYKDGGTGDDEMSTSDFFDDSDGGATRKKVSFLGARSQSNTNTRATAIGLSRPPSSFLAKAESLALPVDLSYSSMSEDLSRQSDSSVDPGPRRGLAPLAHHRAALAPAAVREKDEELDSPANFQRATKPLASALPLLAQRGGVPEPGEAGGEGDPTRTLTTTLTFPSEEEHHLDLLGLFDDAAEVPSSTSPSFSSSRLFSRPHYDSTAASSREPGANSVESDLMTVTSMDAASVEGPPSVHDHQLPRSNQALQGAASVARESESPAATRARRRRELRRQISTRQEAYSTDRPTSSGARRILIQASEAQVDFESQD